MGVLIRLYWKPVYKHIRLKWHKSNDEAKDLAQAFFVRAIEKRTFDSYDPAKARFRTFLRLCLDRFVSNEEKSARRLKRGGDIRLVQLDFDLAESELLRRGVGSAEPAEDAFDREWRRSFFEQVMKRFRDESYELSHEVRYRMFQRCHLIEPGEVNPSYKDLAEEFGISVSDVTNHLAAARRAFRAIVTHVLQEVTDSEEEYEAEAAELLGGRPG